MSLMEDLLSFFQKKRSALVLGGGSARGLAHIGVLKILQRENINFDLVVGTSIGAFIGAFYALGEDIRKAETMSASFNPRENLDIMIPPTMGLIKGDRIYKVIKDFVGEKQFSDTKIPMVIVSTDIEKGEEVIFTNGSLADAIRVSCSYPGIFAPKRINNRLLVDGAIMNNVPVSVARKLGADLVLAVDVGYCVQVSSIKSIFGVILQAFQITGEALSQYQVMHADIAIRPDLGAINQLDFDSGKLAIEKGEIAALEKIKEIKKKIGSRQAKNGIALNPKK
ncbi:MAG: patatin-like phospholipase family protein [Candidatus Omnitrophica bacterium]|nr:patatin-like phospholipase family protein [Candidatus Omnitrophota bacterium]